MSLLAGLSAAQVAGTGTVVSILGPTGGTATPQVIGEIMSFKSSGHKVNVASTTNFDSLGIARKIGTILDYGTVTMTCMRVSGDVGQNAVISAQLTRVPYDFTAQLPKNTLAGQTSTGDLVAFSGIITEAGAFDIDLDKPSEYTFTVDVIAYTVTAGS